MAGRVLLLAVVIFLLILPDEAEGLRRGRRRRCTPVKCAVSSWSGWSSCSKNPCGGTQTRNRTKVRKEVCGGSCPYQLIETQSCNSADGQEGVVVYNACGERCRCRSGELMECTRIRKEFTTMTTAERTKYINTIKVASTDARYKTEYDNLLTSHRNLFHRGIHLKDNFLPWHRWFILQYENLLRGVDCTVTVAYWDWSRVSANAWGGLQRDLWYTGNSGFGGKGRCVQTGPFRQAAWSLVPSANSSCLSREFQGLPPDDIAVQMVLNMPLDQFDGFEMALRDNLHDSVHCVIGGTMCSLDAASAPEFFLHHGFIDKLWADWQAQGSSHRAAHFSSLSHVMPGTSLRPRDLIDLNAHPGGVRVEYRPVSELISAVSDSLVPASFDVQQLGFSRPVFSTANERAMALFGLTPDEIKKVKEIAKKLDPPISAK